MRFDTSQHMRLSQSMKLAPRMIQSMEILQMPLQQLEERIAQELESNAVLEAAEVRGAEGMGGVNGGVEGGLEGAFAGRVVDGGVGDGERERPMEVDEGSGAADFERLEAFEAGVPEAAENAFDDGPVIGRESLRMEEFAGRGGDDRGSAAGAEWGGAEWGGGEGGDAKSEAMANTAAKGATLQEQLREQWGMVDVPEDLRAAGDLIIGYIEDDGYLRTDLETIADRAPAGMFGEGEDEGEAKVAGAALLTKALTALQLLLEPAGVAARDVKECLLLQIDAIEAGEEVGAMNVDRGTQKAAGKGGEMEGSVGTVEGKGTEGRGLEGEGGWKTVRRLIEEHLEDLAQNRLPKIVEKTGLTMGVVKGAVERMGVLSLAPARRLVSERAPNIIPDAIIEYDADGDRYIAYLDDRRVPNLRVNQEYASLAKDRTAPKVTREFLKKNLSNATWLIDAVEQRRRTVLRVIEAIIAAQRDYFDYGPQALKPLPMTQVADQLGIHVATVSRAVAEKYVQTPRGVVPLRGFFTGGTQNEAGEDVSWDAVREALKEVIEGEDKSNPLSDDALAEEVKKRGVEIARRTVAKYRSQLGIPSARLRKVF